MHMEAAVHIRTTVFPLVNRSHIRKNWQIVQGKKTKKGPHDEKLLIENEYEENKVPKIPEEEITLFEDKNYEG